MTNGVDHSANGGPPAAEEAKDQQNATIPKRDAEATNEPPEPKKQRLEAESDGAAAAAHATGDTSGPVEADAAAEEASEPAAVQAGGGEEDAEADGEKESAKPSEPVTLAFRTFANGQECYSYFHGLLTSLTHDQDLNEYEFEMLMDLIRKGHPNPASKIGQGVRAIQIKTLQEMNSTCFFVLRSDGTEEDFSYRKCVSNLWSGFDIPKRPGGGGRGPCRGGGRGGRGGRGGGRGVTGRGRGGRGRGRGRR